MEHDGLILGFAIAFRQQRAVEVLVITAHRQARAATAQVECIVTSFVPALLACYPGSNSFALCLAPLAEVHFRQDISQSNAMVAQSKIKTSEPSSGPGAQRTSQQ